MGMDDREPNFGEVFSEGSRFILMGAEYVGTINTRYGDAEKSLLDIVSREHPDKRVKYTTLGVGIANQARRSEPSDFPRVVELVAIPTGTGGNRVKRLVKVDVEPRDFLDGDDGPAIDALDLAADQPSTQADTDIPF